MIEHDELARTESSDKEGQKYIDAEILGKLIMIRSPTSTAALLMPVIEADPSFGHVHRHDKLVPEPKTPLP